ncbi:MAG: hypothetical protein AAFQ86_17495 [Bacteroidota bacterium]
MSIPFTLPNVYDGLAEGHGLMRVERDAAGDVLVMEVQLAWLGLVKQAPRVVAVPLRDLTEVRFKRGAFKDTLFLRPAHLDLLAELPGKHKERVKLKIKKQYREDVYDLLDELEEWRPVTGMDAS